MNHILWIALLMIGADPADKSGHEKFKIGDRVVVIEPCTLTGGDDGIDLRLNPGAMISVEKLEGSRVWLRGGDCHGWVDVKYIAAMAKAEHIFTTWIQQGSHLAHAYYGRGEIFNKRGDYPRAVQDLTSAIHHAPNDTGYRLARGSIHFQYKQYDLAIADFDDTIRLTEGKTDRYSMTNRAEASYQHGLIRFDEQKYDEAIQDFTRAIQLYPRMVMAHNRRGMAKRLQGRFNEALADFEAAIQLSPTFTAPRNFRAMVLAETGNARAAIEEYERAVALAPETVFLTNSLSLDRHTRWSASLSHNVADYWMLDATQSIQNNLARLLVTCPETTCRDPKRARELVDVLRNQDQGRYYAFLWTEALVLWAEGREADAQQVLLQAVKAAPVHLQREISESLEADSTGRQD